MSRPTGVAVLGATGSIGRSTLNVIRRHPDRFRVVTMTAGSNAHGLDELAAEFKPRHVVLAGEPSPLFQPVWQGEWRYGSEQVAAAASVEDAEIVVNALVGFAGLEATLVALRAGKRLALANKESLVAGGEMVLEVCRQGEGEIVPVDSEHSAILQCLQGRPSSEVSRVILTASGGPFRTLPAASLATVSPKDALAHPTWDMGNKITIDSATLANKALEVIEAHLLFGLDYEQIQVLVHPGSIVHSFVEFQDGSTVAQLGQPNMEVPIQYALSYPERLRNEFTPLDPVGWGPFAFEPPRTRDFPMLGLGIEAGRRGGTAPAVYNAANEVAVAGFLAGELAFPGIAAIVEEAVERIPSGPVEDFACLCEVDRQARLVATEAIRRVGTGNLFPRGG